jgi:hypothetical protein
MVGKTTWSLTGTIWVEIHNCPHCHDHHKRLKAERYWSAPVAPRFAVRVDEGFNLEDDVEATHFVTCPKHKYPLLLRIDVQGELNHYAEKRDG